MACVLSKWYIHSASYFKVASKKLYIDRSLSACVNLIQTHHLKCTFELPTQKQNQPNKIIIITLEYSSLYMQHYTTRTHYKKANTSIINHCTHKHNYSEFVCWLRRSFCNSRQSMKTGKLY